MIAVASEPHITRTDLSPKRHENQPNEPPSNPGRFQTS